MRAHQSFLSSHLSVNMFQFKVFEEYVEHHLYHFSSNCNVVTLSVTGNIADFSVTLMGSDRDSVS